MLRKQMASFLNDAAREGIKKLDKDSLLARQLSKLDVDTILKEDIEKICAAVTFPETMKIMSLGAAVKMGSGDIESIKEDIKKMARVIEDRVEKKQGSLRLPQACRDLLFNL